jgi:hypothetical protein
VNLAFSGGLFKSQPTYLDLIVNRINDEQLKGQRLALAQVHLIDEPAEGALRIAAGNVTSPRKF